MTQAANFPDPAISGTALAIVAGVLAGVALGCVVAYWVRRLGGWR